MLYVWSICLTWTAASSALTGGPRLQQQYEWVLGQQILQYAHEDSFSLLHFQVPTHVQRVEFEVSFPAAQEANQPVKAAVIALRQSAIPVLHLYGEAVPDLFTLPSDQQTHNVSTDGETHALTLKSPAPGTVYLLATVVNPLDDVVQALQWGRPFSGNYIMNVRAVYTVRMDVTSLDTGRTYSLVLRSGDTVTYSFTVPAFTVDYEIVVDNCTANGAENCPVIVSVSETLAADQSASVSVNCSAHVQPCHLRVAFPAADSENYVTFSLDYTSAVDNVTFEVAYIFEDCQVAATHYRTQDSKPTYGYRFEYKEDDSYIRAAQRDASRDVSAVVDVAVNDTTCLNLGRIGRVNRPTSKEFAFDVDFGLWSVQGNVQPILTFVPDFVTQIRALSLQDPLDTGGVLFAELQLLTEEVPLWRGTVRMCALPRRVPYIGSLDNCPGGIYLTVNNSAVTSSAFMPFPRTGVWYLALQSQCFREKEPEPCNTTAFVNVSLRLTQCRSGQCGQFGQCQLFTEGTTTFSACVCQTGYRGLICNDATYGLTKGEQQQAVYLLTLSNLFFIPAILLALRRRFFTLAAIFFFTMFFSSFYHACDTNRVYGVCIMDYDTLSFCDFLGSVLCFWALLVTMARLPEAGRTFLLISGTLIIATLQNNQDERHSMVAHVILVTCAGLVLAVSWALEMYRRRRLFPSWRRYVFRLLPGTLLALTGIVVNFTITDSANYQYSHSFWHVALMLSPCFLMPPGRGGLAGEVQFRIQSVLVQEKTEVEGETVDDLPPPRSARRDSEVSERSPLLAP